MRVCVSVWAFKESSNVSQAPLLMPQPPSSLPSFLPSFSSFTLPLFHSPCCHWSSSLSSSSLRSLPLWCCWSGWWNEITGSRSTVCLSLCLSLSFLSLSSSLTTCVSSWLYQAFCSSAQQQSPERAGPFHFLCSERGVHSSHRQGNYSFSPRGTFSSPFSPHKLVSPSLSLFSPLSLSISLSLSQLPYYDILYLRATDLP